MRKTILDNITGRRFGRLLVINESKRRGKDRYFNVLCDCGVKKEVLGYNLVYGDSVSCGCYQRENMSRIKSTHRLTKHPLYSRLRLIMRRCYDEKNKSYKDYGGRGITVCEEWREDFMSFYNWATSNGYERELQLDRIDNDGPYAPWNCRWVTSKVNNNNRRDTKYIEFRGEYATLEVILDKYSPGISKEAYTYRINAGWSIEDSVLTEPYKKIKKRTGRK